MTKSTNYDNLCFIIYFPSRSKYFPKYPVVKTSLPVYFPQYEGPSLKNSGEYFHSVKHNNVFYTVIKLSSWRCTEQNSYRPTVAILGAHVSRNNTVFLILMSRCGFPTLDSTISGLPIGLFVQIILISHIYKLAF